MRSRSLGPICLVLLTPACGDDGSADEGQTGTTSAQTGTATDGSDGEATAGSTAETSAGMSASADGTTSTDDGSASGDTTGGTAGCVPVDERSLTVAEAMVRHVSPAWTGDGIGIAWSDARHGDTEIYFGRFDAAGDPLADEVRLTDATGASGVPAIAANDEGFGIAWADERNGPEVMWRRVADDGTAIGDELVLGPGDGFPSVAWTGTEHGVAFSGPADGDPEIFFSRVTDAAEPPSRISVAMGGSFLPALAWDGEQFGLAWQDLRAAGSGIYVTRVGADGMEIGDESWLTPEGGGGANLAFTGDAFLVGWSHVVTGNTDRDVRARYLDASGAPQGDELVLVPGGATQAAITTSDTGEIGVAVAGAEILFARFDATGAAIGRTVQLSNGLVVPQDEAPWPRIVAAGEGFAITWADHRSGEGEAFYVRTCP